VAPTGGLIYDGPVAGTIAAPAATDTYTLSLDGDQTVALVVHPLAQGLRPGVALVGPDGTVLAAATAPGAGADAAVPAFQIRAAGTYTFAVSGTSATTGAFTSQAVLNVGVELEGHGRPTNDALQTAQRLDATTVPVGGANDHLAALGTIEGGPALGDVYVTAEAQAGGTGEHALVVSRTGDDEADLVVAQSIAMRTPSGQVNVHASISTTAVRGVYNLGTLLIDMSTAIKMNHVSSSDDIFG
jgi:hypothetical protein